MSVRMYVGVLRYLLMRMNVEHVGALATGLGVSAASVARLHPGLRFTEPRHAVRAECSCQRG